MTNSCYVMCLIIENDPVSVYLILYHLYLNNEKSVKLKYYNKISQVNYKTEYTTKMACIFYHILKICFPKFFKKNDFINFLEQLIQKFLVHFPVYGKYQMIILLMKIFEDSYNIINLYLKNGLDMFLIFTAFKKIFKK